jgi:hypothetical protein
VRLELVRFAYLEDCTLGRLTLPGGVQLATIERPWVPNPLGAGGKLSTSCVPDGLYTLQPYDSPKHGPTWCLVNDSLGVHFDKRPEELVGRTMIQLHVANRAAELEGCIAPGMKTAGHAVAESAIAMKLIRTKFAPSTIGALLIRPTSGTAED